MGHALLLAKLQPAQQEQALAACFKEEWSERDRKAKRILLPVRHLQLWIEHNILLILKQATFNKRDAQLIPAAGSCVDCPKRTGHNKLLFADVSQGNSDACTDPTCYAAKLEAHVQKQIAAKPELVQISTAYGQQQEGSKIVTRSKYVEIRPDKPDTPEKAKWPEFKTCRYTTEAIVSDGIDKGELRKVCTQADCPVHHPKKQPTKADASFKAEQEKSRREARTGECHRHPRLASHRRRRSCAIDEARPALHRRTDAPVARRQAAGDGRPAAEASSRRMANPPPSC